MSASVDRIFVGRNVVVKRKGTDLVVAELGHGTQVNATGRVAEELAAFFEHGTRGPILASFDAAHPIAQLMNVLEGQPWVPLDRTHAVRLDGLHTLFIELTGRCNERCVHCYADAGPEISSSLSRETVEKLLVDARAMGVEHVQFTGGDPLLCPFLPELVVHARELGFGGREIYTNGLALTDALLDRLAPGGPQFAFSFYSHDPERHDRITRTRGSHGHTIEAIRRVVERGWPLRVSILVMEENAGDARATYEYLRGLGVERVRAGGTVAVGRGQVFDVDNPAGLEAGPDHRPGLALPEGKLCVTSEGNVVPCIFNRDEHLGSIHEQSLAAILASPRRKPRVLTVLGDERELSCASCRVTRFALAACEDG